MFGHVFLLNLVSCNPFIFGVARPFSYFIVCLVTVNMEVFNALIPDNFGDLKPFYFRTDVYIILLRPGS